jgi:nicotinamidase-related amidase
MALDKNRTAVLIIDPQNDFLSEKGVVWDLVGAIVEENQVVPHLVAIREAAKEAGFPVVYSPHFYNDQEYSDWKHLNPIDSLMFERKMFHSGKWGADWLPELAPDDNTFVVSPHKGLSGFWSNDIGIQLRQRNVDTIVLAGMSANLCVESHLRDAVENGFEVIVIKDATAGPGPEATQAAYVNYSLIATEVTTTDDIVDRLKAA